MFPARRITTSCGRRACCHRDLGNSEIGRRIAIAGRAIIDAPSSQSPGMKGVDLVARVEAKASIESIADSRGLLSNGPNTPKIWPSDRYEHYRRK